MANLAIGWEYLTGYCVATDPASREKAEWPPHPARVFMALAAAWFETGEEGSEGAALSWLEQQGEPRLLLPDDENVFARAVVDVYVPVNDQPDPYDWPDKKKKATIHGQLGSVAIGRSRQARTYPTVRVGETPCFLTWPNVEEREVSVHRVALEHLCDKVTRIGHSSSLVRMWVTDDPQSPTTLAEWEPSGVVADRQVRRISHGMLQYLEHQFNGRGRAEFELLSDQIEVLKAEKPKGKGAAVRKAEIKVTLEQLAEKAKAVNSRDALRPKIGLWTGYSRATDLVSKSQQPTLFDNELLVLTQVQGPRLPVTSTLTVTQALRGALLAHCGSTIPEWISGHQANGEPLRDGREHLAFIPLPNVGHDYADGHLLGMALVFPREVFRQERGRFLGRFLLDIETREPREIRLTMGRLGEWTLTKRDAVERRHALSTESWTAQPLGAKTWATVTPMVLDRFPKSDASEDRLAWQAEVAEMITAACTRIKLPPPIALDFGTTCWHQGSPRAVGKRRPLRGHDNFTLSTTSLGDGFPHYPAKNGNSSKPQLHVYLQFEQPIVGPIIIGAGRYMGYGLCKPIRGTSK